MMRCHEMEDEVLKIRRQCPETHILLNDRKRSEFMPITIEQPGAQRTLRFGVGLSVARRVKRPLPASRPLSFIMQACGDSKGLSIIASQSDRLGYGERPPLCPRMMFR